MTNPYAPPAAPVDDVVGVVERAEPAGRGVRLGAAILDGIVFGALVYLPFFTGLIAFTTNRRYTQTGAGVALLLGGFGLAIWAYLTIKYIRANGQSIAKRVLGIKVVRSDGTPARSRGFSGCATW